MDYETFVNSAYLCQGRADEFMLKRPAERKQILEDLLKLDQYDTLAEQAKERSRQFKAELDGDATAQPIPVNVTHMPRFKDALQTHVEVFKTDQGSQLRLSF